jgi:hypothetical protein
MRTLIPGLDASLVIDERGVSYWAINKDWRPPQREKRESVKKQDKGGAGDDGGDRFCQDALWQDLASR